MVLKFLPVILVLCIMPAFAFAQDAEIETDLAESLDGIELPQIDTDPQTYLDRIKNAFTTDERSFYDLLAFSAGMVVYGIFVWHFYQVMARREMFKIGLQKLFSSSSLSKRFCGWMIKNILVFPLSVFLWFIVYSTFMFFLAQKLPSDTVFLVVGSLVVAVRISAFYKENLAQDLAKLLPFAMLGIFLTSPIFFEIDKILDRVYEIPAFIGKIAIFMVVIMLVEGVLSTIFVVKGSIFKSQDEKKLEEKIDEKVDQKMDEKVKQIEEKFDDKKKDIEKEHDDLEEKIDKKHKELEADLQDQKKN